MYMLVFFVFDTTITIKNIKKKRERERIDIYAIEFDSFTRLPNMNNN